MASKYKTNAKGDVVYTKKMKEFRKKFDPPTPAWLLKAAGAVATAIGVKKPKKAATPKPKVLSPLTATKK